MILGQPCEFRFQPTARALALARDHLPHDVGGLAHGLVRGLPRLLQLLAAQLDLLAEQLRLQQARC